MARTATQTFGPHHQGWPLPFQSYVQQQLVADCPFLALAPQQTPVTACLAPQSLMQASRPCCMLLQRDRLPFSSHEPVQHSKTLRAQQNPLEQKS
ncbi:hypothetical protein ABBQ38_013262 [Trebouxia sp. C0009 RCD-2024]